MKALLMAWFLILCWVFIVAEIRDIRGRRLARRQKGRW